MRTKEYKIISAKNIDDLEDKVMEYVRNGWKLQGGITSCAYYNGNAGSMYGYGPNHTFSQAVVRSKWNLLKFLRIIQN